MKVVGQKEQQKIRRKASESLLVYDLSSGSPIGEILDMSAKGMKLLGERPAMVRQVFYCRIPLNNGIDGNDEVFVDAECRWCKKSEKGDLYNSGYILRFPSPKDASIIQKLILSWMADQANRLNARYSVPARRSWLYGWVRPAWVFLIWFLESLPIQSNNIEIPKLNNIKIYLTIPHNTF